MRGKPKTLARALLATVMASLLMTGFDVWALQPCKRQRPVWVVYPPPNAAVPRNTAVFVIAEEGVVVHLNAETGGRLMGVLIDKRERATMRLLEKEGQRPIAVRVAADVDSQLVRIIPAAPLTAGREYQLQYGPLEKELESRRYLRDGLGPGVITVFRVTQEVASGEAPVFKQARLQFSRPQRRKLYRGRVMVGKAGRDAVFVSSFESQAATVLEWQVAFRSAGKRKWLRCNAADAYSPSVMISTTGGVCGYIPCRPAAPSRGRFELRVIGWSPTGMRGPDRILKGRIR